MVFTNKNREPLFIRLVYRKYMREVQVFWKRSVFDGTPMEPLFEIIHNLHLLGYAERGESYLDLIIQGSFQSNKGPSDLDGSIPGLSVLEVISAPSTGYEKETVLKIRMEASISPVVAVQLKVPSVSMLPETGLGPSGISYAVRGPAKSVKPAIDLLRMVKTPSKISAKSIGTETIISDGVVSPEQVRVIKAAFECGWYARPREITMSELAKKINLSRSTVAEHLAKVESALIEILLDSSSVAIVAKPDNEQSIERAYSMIHPSDLALLKANVKQAEKTREPYVVTARFSRPDGSYFLGRVNGKPEFDEEGTLVRTIGTFEDLTGHKEMEKVLNLSVNIANSHNDIGGKTECGTWEWNVANGEVTWSKQLFQLYGCTDPDFEPSLESFVSLLHPDERDFVHNTLGEAIATLSPLDFTHRIIRPNDNDTRTMRCTGGIMTDENGHPERVIGMATDVTEIAEAEKSFQETIRSVQKSNIGNYIVDEISKSVTVDSRLMEILDL